MTFERLRLEISQGVAELTLCRPEGANAIDLTAANELAEAAIVCHEDPAVRAVLIRAEGAIFCAGGDVRSFREAESVPALLRRITAGLHVAISRFARMDAPVVCAVGGTAAGAGMSLACACDIVLAAETAKFTMAYTKIGLVPDGSSSWFLPRRVGIGRARDLMLRNRVLGAADALEWGIVEEVVPAAELDERARKVARELAAGPTLAYGFTKRLLLDSFANGLETQMELETIGIATAGASADVREGLSAFFEKRAPKYVGK